MKVIRYLLFILIININATEKCNTVIQVHLCSNLAADFPGMALYIDGAHHRDIKGNGGAFCINLTPGTHTISLFNPRKILSLHGSSVSNQLNAGIRELSGYSSGFARAGAIEDEETAHNMATAVFDTYVQENESYRITFQMKCDHGRNRKCDPDEFSFKISKTISK